MDHETVYFNEKGVLLTDKRLVYEKTILLISHISSASISKKIRWWKIIVSIFFMALFIYTSVMAGISDINGNNSGFGPYSYIILGSISFCVVVLMITTRNINYMAHIFTIESDVMHISLENEELANKLVKSIDGIINNGY